MFFPTTNQVHGPFTHVPTPCFLNGILDGQFLLHIMVVFLPIHRFVYGLLMFVILLFVFLFMILLFSHDLFLHVHVHSFYHKKDVTLL